MAEVAVAAAAAQEAGEAEAAAGSAAASEAAGPAEVGSVRECLDLLQQVLLLYEKERTLEAYRVLGRVEAQMERWRASGGGGEGDEFAQLESIHGENALLFQRVREEAERVKVLLRELESDESWEMCRDEGGVQTLYKHADDSPCYYLQIRGEIEAPAFEVLAVINEIDLYSTWVTMLDESKVLLDISSYKRMIHMTFSMPAPVSWVISDRDMLLYGFGVDMMEEGKLAAVSHSASPDLLQRLRDEFGFRAPEPEQRIRMDARVSGLVCTPISRTRTRVQVVTNVDPKVSLPYYIINTTTKNLAYIMFQKLNDQAMNLSEPYRERIDAEGSIYGDIREKLDRLFAAQDM